MKIEIKKTVGSHKFNDNYFCVLVQFEESDLHYWHNSKNWLPKDDEMVALFKVLYAMSPTFKEKIESEFVILNKVKKECQIY